MSLTTGLGPLSRDEQISVERVGVRLGSELRIAIHDLPLEARANARVMARVLSLDLALCQSVLDAVHTVGDGIRTVAALPGKASMSRFVHALERKLGRKNETLGVALIQYVQVIDSVAPTPAIAEARIEEHLRNPSRGFDLARDLRTAQETSFMAMSRITNSWSDMVTDTRLLQRDATDPGLMMETALTAQIGLRTRGVGFPISSHSWQTGKDQWNLLSQDGVACEPRRPLLVKEFSTYPLPIVSSRGEGGSNMSLIDVRLDESLEHVDVAQERIASRLPAPSNEDPLWSCAVSSRNPTRRMIVTYFMPRELAERSVVSAAGYFWHPGLSGDPARHWHEQVPGKIVPEVLGVGIEGAQHPDEPRLARMAEYLFARCGVSPAGYVGHRMTIEFPIWGALYYLTFDFRS